MTEKNYTIDKEKMDGFIQETLEVLNSLSKEIEFLKKLSEKVDDEKSKTDFLVSIAYHEDQETMLEAFCFRLKVLLGIE